MDKIASPQDLASELRSLLASCQGQESPSRETLASQLNELADKVAKAPKLPQRTWKVDGKAYKSLPLAVGAAAKAGLSGKSVKVVGAPRFGETGTLTYTVSVKGPVSTKK